MLVLLVALLGFVNADQVTFGSAVKLSSGADAKSFFLRSVEVQWNNRPAGHNIVTTANDETNPEVYWAVVPTVHTDLSGSPVKCGSTIKLRHAVSNRALFVNTNQKSSVAFQHEVTAITADVGPGDVFTVECSSGVWTKGKPVSFKHVAGYLRSSYAWLYTQQNCPRCPIVGQREVVVSNARHSQDCNWTVAGGVIVREPEEQADGDQGSGKDEL